MATSIADCATVPGGESPSVDGGVARAVLDEAFDPVLEVLAHHYGRSFGEVHAVGCVDARQA
jgi:hypothetical protein